MADVFSQLYVQLVFAVKNRRALIEPVWEERLFEFTTGIIRRRGHKMLAVGGMPDHIHLFIGQKPAEALSDLVREVKKETNQLIGDNRLCKYKFDWQSGFGAFSYSRSHVDAVCRYILNQKNHHRKKTFQEEYLKMISDFEIEIGQKDMFKFFE
jgi:putative transposase